MAVNAAAQRAAAMNPVGRTIQNKSESWPAKNGWEGFGFVLY